MTHPHHHQMFVAHVKEPDGKIVDAIIGTEHGVSVEDAKARLEFFLSTQPDGKYEVVGFHPLEVEEEEPAQAPRHMNEFPNALQKMVLTGYALMVTILMLVRYLYRRSN